MVMTLAVMVLSIYFFLVDGRRLVLFLKRNSFFPPAKTDRLVRVVGGACRSVILATVVSGFAQALVEVLGCLLTRTANVPLIGSLVFAASFIPVVGSAPVTFGVAIQQLFLGRTGAGIGLLVTAIGVIAADNTIRPWFLKGSVNLHPLLAFVSALGGLQVFGFLGVFIGPILAALFVLSIEMMTTAD